MIWKRRNQMQSKRRGLRRLSKRRRKKWRRERLRSLENRSCLSNRINWNRWSIFFEMFSKKNARQLRIPTSCQPKYPTNSRNSASKKHSTTDYRISFSTASSPWTLPKRSKNTQNCTKSSLKNSLYRSPKWTPSWISNTWSCAETKTKPREISSLLSSTSCTSNNSCLTKPSWGGTKAAKRVFLNTSSSINNAMTFSRVTLRSFWTSPNSKTIYNVGLTNRNSSLNDPYQFHRTFANLLKNFNIFVSHVTLVSVSFSIF